jgi:hypothetical protein
MMRDVDIELHVSPELKLASFEFGETKLDLVSRNEDFTRFNVRRCPELSAGQKLNFRVIFSKTPPSNSFVEVNATAHEGTQPTKRRLVFGSTN